MVVMSVYLIIHLPLIAKSMMIKLIVIVLTLDVLNVIQLYVLDV